MTLLGADLRVGEPNYIACTGYPLLQFNYTISSVLSSQHVYICPDGNVNFGECGDGQNCVKAIPVDDCIQKCNIKKKQLENEIDEQANKTGMDVLKTWLSTCEDACQKMSQN